MGMLRSTWKAMKVQAWQGEIKQQGGAFVFGPGKWKLQIRFYI